MAQDKDGTTASFYCWVFIFLINYFLATFVARGILVPWPGIKPVTPALEAESLNHWSTRAVSIFTNNWEKKRGGCIWCLAHSRSVTDISWMNTWGIWLLGATNTLGLCILEVRYQKLSLNQGSEGHCFWFQASRYSRKDENRTLVAHCFERESGSQGWLHGKDTISLDLGFIYSINWAVLAGTGAWSWPGLTAEDFLNG